MMILSEILENDIYSMDVRVGFEECDPNLTMKLSDFLKYIIRTAGFHYALRGVPHKMMYDHGQVFVLSKLNLKIEKLPLYGDKITVSTWERKNESVYALRDYEVRNEEGELLGAATSNWIIINPHTRSILRPSAFDLCEYRPLEKTSGCKPCEKIRPDTNCPLVDKRMVRLSDTDANGHLHSAFYAYFVTDALPLNKGKAPREFEINFVKEACAEDVLELYAKDEGQSVNITAINNDATCFTAKITY
jgi:acyl-ACP thioesterase